MHPPSILFVCWSRRPIHGTLIQAASEALNALGWRCMHAGSPESAPPNAPNGRESVRIISPWKFLFSLLDPLTEPPDAIFFQSIHPANILIGLWARINKVYILYYLHEPTTLGEKLKKGDPLGYSIMVRFTQWIETKVADVLLVATKALIDQALHCYPHSNALVLELPLSIPDLRPSGHPTPQARHRILYLGRAHPMRCLEEFSRLAQLLSESRPDIHPTMLTYNTLDRSLPHVEVRGGRTYSDQEMLELLDESVLVWNVYNVEYSQSGVTPVALRSGIPLLVSSYEKEKDLSRYGVAFEVQLSPFNPQLQIKTIDDIVSDFENISRRCEQFYQANYSPQSLLPYLSSIPLFSRFS